MRFDLLAIVAALGICFCALPGCGGAGGENTVVAPPEEPESDLPMEGISEEEYAREMAAGT